MVWSVALSPDGQMIASTSGDTARVLDVLSRKMIAVLERNTVSFSVIGERIISSCKDKTVRIWSARMGEAIGSPLEGHIGRLSDPLPALTMGDLSCDGTMRKREHQYVN